MKTAIVTGASKGVGYATVKLLSENGYKVIALSRNLENISKLVSDNVEIYQLDITQPNAIKEFYEKYKDITLDLLVNNAGGGSGPTSIIRETMDNFRIAYEINVSGPMSLSQLFVPALQKSESPTIIFISSLGGKIPYRGGGNYTNAKRGQMALVDTMRMEFSEYKIDWGDNTPIETVNDFPPNYYTHTYSVPQGETPGGYAIQNVENDFLVTMSGTSPWGINIIQKKIHVPFQLAQINNPNGTAYFIPQGNSWSATPIEYNYLFTGDSNNNVEDHVSSNYTPIPFIITGYTISSINDFIIDNNSLV